jgi:HAD superfamily hydrolase (TIGR01509 family)
MVQEAVARREQNFLRIVSEQGVAALPGVMDLIREAQAAPDFRLAVATSGTPTKVLAVLQALGLGTRDFDAMVTAADFSKRKPDPEIYLVAARRLGLPPAQCAVIEDAPAGIEAARRAGVFAVAVTSSTSAENLRRADRVVESASLIGLGMLREAVRRRLANGNGRDGDKAAPAGATPP